MSVFLEKLWVLNESGVIIYTSAQRDLIEQDLLGSLLSATCQLSEGMLKWFSTKRTQFVLIERNKILFVFQFKLKTNKIDDLQLVENLVSKFFDLFSKRYIVKYGHRTERFEAFKGLVNTKKEVLGNFINKKYNHS